MGQDRHLEAVGTAHDLVDGRLTSRRALHGRLAQLFESQGYRPIDVPILESSRLYLRKWGTEGLSGVYSFRDPRGEEVSLRPEFTASVIRHYIQHESSYGLPVRWH